MRCVYHIYIDLLMAYVMPLRKVYTSYKYKETKGHDELAKRATSMHHIEPSSHSDGGKNSINKGDNLEYARLNDEE